MVSSRRWSFWWQWRLEEEGVGDGEKDGREQVGFLSLFVSRPFVTADLDEQLSNRVDPVPGKASFPFLLHVAIKGGARILFWEIFWSR
jgi:hypothetical protein